MARPTIFEPIDFDDITGLEAELMEEIKALSLPRLNASRLSEDSCTWNIVCARDVYPFYDWNGKEGRAITYETVDILLASALPDLNIPDLLRDGVNQGIWIQTLSVNCGKFTLFDPYLNFMKSLRPVTIDAN